MMISLITVTKNNLTGLKATAKSIEAQNTTDYEWIVVDGGSDESKDVIFPIFPSSGRKPGYCATNDQIPACAGMTNDGNQDDKVVYIREPDNGIYDAMNKGIERSSGDYVIFLNAGDTLTPGALQTITEQDADFIYGDALEGGQYKKARSHQAAALGMFTHHQAMIYKRAIIGELRYDERYKIAADYDFTLRFLQKTGSVSYIPQALCDFEMGGVSQINAALGRREQFQIRKSLRLSNAIENSFIYATQMLIWNFRKLMPGIYWLFKKTR